MCHIKTTIVILFSKAQGKDRCDGSRKQKHMQTCCNTTWQASLGKGDTPLVSCVYIGSEQLGDTHRMSLVEFHLCSPGGRVRKNMDLSNDKVAE